MTKQQEQDILRDMLADLVIQHRARIQACASWRGMKPSRKYPQEKLTEIANREERIAKKLKNRILALQSVL